MRETPFYSRYSLWEGASNILTAHQSHCKKFTGINGVPITFLNEDWTEAWTDLGKKRLIKAPPRRVVQKPVRYLTSLFEDRRDAIFASFFFDFSEIIVFMCQRKTYPIRFSCCRSVAKIIGLRVNSLKQQVMFKFVIFVITNKRFFSGDFLERKLNKKQRAQSTQGIF